MFTVWLLLCAVGTARSGDVVWQTAAVDTVDDVVTAIDVAGTDHLAVGDGRGVQVGRVPSDMRSVALRGGVRDLAFWVGRSGAEPAVLASTPSGLYRVDASGRVSALALAPSAQVRSIARIAVAAGIVAVATEAGVYFSHDSEHWQRLWESLPSGAASAVALRERAGVVQCWAAVRGELWRSDLRWIDGRLVAAPGERIPIPRVSGGRTPVDIWLAVLDAPGPDTLLRKHASHVSSEAVAESDVVVVFPTALVARWKGEKRWEVLRPPLPPGAEAGRLARALGSVWLATDRGLLRAAQLRGPWRRALEPAGSNEVFDLTAADDTLYVATRAGLVVGRASPSPNLARAVRLVPLESREPSVERVHRAAIAYLNLQPARIAAMNRGVARRGWLPIVDFHIGGEFDRRRTAEYDEAYISSGLRQLYDRDRDHSRELELDLSFSWDLGDVAYHPEVIDVSHEAREIIELRDDVLDEVTQLYFERLRVLAEVAAIESSSEADAVRLGIRARELAAGIDAWTGGWFSRELQAVTP